MGKMSSSPALIRIADLAPGDTHALRFEPDADTRAGIAADLGIPALRKLRLDGQLTPLGRRDWALQATLGATAVQDCVVTLQPVTTRIDEPVRRTYLAEMPELPEGDEIEMPEDDSAEPLPDTLDLRALATEALALALPPYPRADGLDPLEAQFTEPGAQPMRDDDAKPFAGLAALRDKFSGDD